MVRVADAGTMRAPVDAVTDLAVWLRQQLDTDEQVARAASTDRGGSTPGGEHWRWECSNCDTPLPITPVTLLAEFMECPTCASVGVALRSVETYPIDWDKRGLPHFVVSGAEELRPVDGLHLQTHDPARVLRTVDAHRAIVDQLEQALADDATDETAQWMLRTLAVVYADRPGFLPEWKVDL